MSKTPLQQAIEHMGKLQNEGYITANLNSVVHILKSLLPTERDVIEDAYKMGTIYGDINDSETYFTTKFNDNGTDAKG